jgi:Leucine-rich repeat (LRR) protein
MIRILLSTVMAFAAATAYASGGEVGNGGDTIQCERATDNFYSGLYSLDFLLTLQTDNSDLVQVKNWEQSRDRIRTLLKTKFPDLGTLFEDYLAGNPFSDPINGEYKYIQRRIWDEAPYGLVDIKDERVVRKLPHNCYKLKAPDEINVIQSVIRQRKEDVVIYDYDPDNTKELRENAPLQLSYLLLHEFLWDFTDDVSVVRRANRFIHSNNMEKLTADQLQLSLENIWINLKTHPPLPVCQRTKEVREAIEYQMGKTCDQITTAEMNKVQNLFLSGRGINTVFPWDLSGFKSLNQVDLTHNLISDFFADAFYDLPKVVGILSLSDNLLKPHSWKFLSHFETVYTLTLANNQIEVLPEDSQYLPLIETLDLSNNRIKEVSVGFLKGLCHAPRRNLPSIQRSLVIQLNGNQVQSVPQEGCDYCRSNGIEPSVFGSGKGCQ